MSRMRLPGGRTGLPALIAACVVAGVAAVPAQAVSGNVEVEAAAGDVFQNGDGPGGATDFNLVSGSTTIIDNIDPDTTHNVTAAKDTAFPVTLNGTDGKPLFSSGDVFPNNAAPIQGIQYLADGEHHFYCTIHPSSMQGTFQISGNDAVARPKITVAIKASKLGKVAGKGKLPVSVHAVTQSNGVTLTAKLGKKTLGSVKGLNLSAGSTRKLSVKLTGAGKSALKNKSKATVKLLGSVRFGSPASASKKLG